MQMRPQVRPGPGISRCSTSSGVLACACVLGQHSFLWTDMANNVVGTGFITFLHFTRNSFFFLSGLVVCYAQITRPRTVWGFWVRRYVQMGIPYLAWTGIYVLFTILRPGGSWSQWGTYLWSDLRLGYYQLYVVVVLFQFYLVFPFLLKLLKSTSTRSARADHVDQRRHRPLHRHGSPFQSGHRHGRSLRPRHRIEVGMVPQPDQLSGVLRRRSARGVPLRGRGRIRAPLVTLDPAEYRRRGRGDDALVRDRHCAGRINRVGLGHLRADRGGLVLRSHRRPLCAERAVVAASWGGERGRGRRGPVPRLGPVPQLGPMSQLRPLLPRRDGDHFSVSGRDGCVCRRSPTWPD